MYLKFCNWTEIYLLKKISPDIRIIQYYLYDRLIEFWAFFFCLNVRTLYFTLKPCGFFGKVITQENNFFIEKQKKSKFPTKHWVHVFTLEHKHKLCNLAYAHFSSYLNRLFFRGADLVVTTQTAKIWKQILS
jgi:hypothetical protein